jgi:hypothetical protein
MHDTTDETPPSVAAEVLAGAGLNLGQAARRFPSYRESKPVNPSTVFRWITGGVRLPGGARVRLDAVRLGGRWLTSVQAIERFIAAQTPTFDDAAAARPPKKRPRARAAERAAKELERIGI